MRYAIFSDIHGNLPALEAVLHALEHEAVDAVCCGGDLVGYGANPNECVAMVRDRHTMCVAGNHDWGALGKIGESWFNTWAREAIVWTKSHLSADSTGFLNHLELTLEQSEFMVVHGSLNEPQNFEYMVQASQSEETFRLLGDKNLCFVGHTHVPNIFISDHQRCFETSDPELKMKAGCQYIINVGSVGQPRDRDPRAAYCVYDSVERTISIKRVSYDIPQAQQAIFEAGLPPFLATRLALGQ